MKSKKIQKSEKLLFLAQKVAENAHKGQKDKGGNDYIGHPRAVADSLEITEQKIVAYLHDVCEDTDITPDDLLEMGFPHNIVNSIRIITKNHKLSYEEYLKRVKADEIARAVKIADIRHNMDISRIPQPTEKDFARLEKYRKAIAFLEND